MRHGQGELAGNNFNQTALTFFNLEILWHLSGKRLLRIQCDYKQIHYRKPFRDTF